MHKDGLQCYVIKNYQVTPVQNVRENEAGYRERQLNNSMSARKLYYKFGHPSHKDFRNNIIRNFPVNLEGTNRADNIYGPKIATLKGRTNHSKTESVVDDYITVPREIMKANNNITISGDILFINKIPLFMTISRNIKFTIIECIRNRTLKQLINSMGNIKSIYTKRGFSIRKSLMD